MEELVESYKVEDLVNKMKEIKQQMIQEKKEWLKKDGKLSFSVKSQKGEENRV